MRRIFSPPDPRVAALRRFALSISALTVAGAFWLGFEDPWAQPVLALAVAYVLELALETLDARLTGRPPRYAARGVAGFVDFMLPAHIAALSIALLIYPGDRLIAIVFAVTVAIGSKFILRVPVGGRRRHFLNPSNAGISATLLLFPWVGIAPPYAFTENTSGAVDWLVPAAFLVAGTMLNAKLTGKWPLILGWVGGFAAQGLLRAALLGSPVVAPLLPMTGAMFVLYTNYMITDPGTTPVRRDSQVAFGASTAAVYGVLTALHAAFGLFFALTIVSTLRGAGLVVLDRRETVAGLLHVRTRRPAATSSPARS